MSPFLEARLALATHATHLHTRRNIDFHPSVLQIMFLVFAGGLVLLITLGLGLCLLRGSKRQLPSLARRLSLSPRSTHVNKFASESKESCPTISSTPTTPNAYTTPTSPSPALIESGLSQTLSPSFSSLHHTRPVSSQFTYPSLQSIALAYDEKSASSCSLMPSCSLYACTTTTTIPHSSATSVPSTATSISRGGLGSDMNESFQVIHAQSHVIRISRATVVSGIFPDTIEVPDRALTSDYSGHLRPDHDGGRSYIERSNVLPSSSTVTVNLDEFPKPPAPLPVSNGTQVR